MLDLGVAVAEIATAVQTSRTTVYTIRENLDLWGLPHPSKDEYRTGRLPVLTAAQAQVGDASHGGIEAACGTNESFIVAP
jgi:hypothetical protein